MPTWPTQGWPNPPVITPWSYSSLATVMSQSGLAYPAAAATIVQNQAYYVPFVICDVAFLARQMFVHNGATVDGTIDLGIYDNQGNRRVSITPQTMTGASALQWVNITDTTLQPGQYWMAFASSSATATFFTRTGSLQQWRGSFTFQQASASTLPDPATFAAATFGSLPTFGVSSRTF